MMRVASSMAAALTASAYGASSLVVENAAESALEHHLGMTCDPVAGYVQVGVTTSYATVVAAAAARGETAIGYRVTAEGSDGIIVNPSKSRVFTIAPDDLVIVLADD